MTTTNQPLFDGDGDDCIQSALRKTGQLDRAHRAAFAEASRVDLRGEPRKAKGAEVVIRKPPIFGDANSARKFIEATEAARETQRLSGIRCAVRHGWSVTVAKKTWKAGDPIEQRDVPGDAWAEIKPALSLIERHHLATRCEHGATHIVLSGGVRSYTLGSRCCARDFHRDAVSEVAEVGATLAWNGVVRPGRAPVEAVAAIDGRAVVADLVTRGRLRALTPADGK